MNKKLERVKGYFTEEQLNQLNSKKVLIIGLGGVGGLVCETLIRNGVYHFGLCDGDIVEESNFNRQIIAINKNIGLNKVEAMTNRLKEIEDNIEIDSFPFFIDKETIHNIDFTRYDLILDCIDDVIAKVLIIEKAKKLNINIISSMGTGNKCDPNGFKIVNINQTCYCPLAKRVRTELKKIGITDVQVCFSSEIPLKGSSNIISPMFVVGSASFVIVKRALEILAASN